MYMFLEGSRLALALAAFFPSRRLVLAMVIKVKGTFASSRRAAVPFNRAIVPGAIRLSQTQAGYFAMLLGSYLNTKQGS